MADVGLMLTLLEVAVKKIHSLYKSHEHFKRELKEVKNLLRDIKKSSPIFKTQVVSDNMDKVKKNLHKKLDPLTKRVHEWSWTSSDLSFIILHSDRRLAEIRDVREKVNCAMLDALLDLGICNVQLLEEIEELMNVLAARMGGQSPNLHQHLQQPLVAPKPSEPKPSKHRRANPSTDSIKSSTHGVKPKCPQPSDVVAAGRPKTRQSRSTTRAASHSNSSPKPTTLRSKSVWRSSERQDGGAIRANGQ